jgi:hypothetical protein
MDIKGLNLRVTSVPPSFRRGGHAFSSSAATAVALATLSAASAIAIINEDRLNVEIGEDDQYLALTDEQRVGLSSVISDWDGELADLPAEAFLEALQPRDPVDDGPTSQAPDPTQEPVTEGGVAADATASAGDGEKEQEIPQGDGEASGGDAGASPETSSSSPTPGASTNPATTGSNNDLGKDAKPVEKKPAVKKPAKKPAQKKTTNSAASKS